MEPGRVVEFIDGGKFITALVTRIKGGKLLVLSETDREMSVSAGRILADRGQTLNPTHPRHDLIRSLKEISGRRHELSRQLNLIELWELLDGEGEEFSYDYLAELAFPGPIAGDQVAAVPRAVFADGLYFKMRADQVLRQSAQKVEQIVQDRDREAERENRLSAGGDWLSRVWKGDLGDEPECLDTVVRALKNMTWYGAEAPDFKWGRSLMERAGLGPDPWRPFQLLVKMGEMGLHENLDLVRLEVPEAFPAEVLREAEALVSKPGWEGQDRRDLTHLDTITADSSGARDFDDAVSLEIKDGLMVLGVHIADVSGAVRPGTALDALGLLRGTSIYMPDNRIPMLPEILSEECLSLKQGEVRPAFSLLIELDDQGEVLDYEFTPSRLKVHRQLSYQEVDAAVETDLLLGRMHRLGQTLQARRVAAGALILPLPKLNVYLTPEGEIGVNLTHWENPGRSMIGEFMILANHLAAKFLGEHGAACLYRTQEEPSQRVVPGDSDCRELFPCLRQRKYLSRVKWGLEAAPHHGMGLTCYTNLTSPLRRYIDLLVQRQVRSILMDGRPFYSPEEMDEALTAVETVLRRAVKLQNNRRRYWLLRYLEIHGREYEALVLEKYPHRWRIFLLELMMDADLPAKNGRDLTPGQTITVRIGRVNAREDILRFEQV